MQPFLPVHGRVESGGEAANLPGLHAFADLLKAPFGNPVLFGVVNVKVEVGDCADPYYLDREDQFFGDAGKRKPYRLVRRRHGMECQVGNHDGPPNIASVTNNSIPDW